VSGGTKSQKTKNKSQKTKVKAEPKIENPNRNAGQSGIRGSREALPGELGVGAARTAEMWFNELSASRFFGFRISDLNYPLSDFGF
jgi:hypothetical protein